MPNVYTELSEEESNRERTVAVAQSMQNFEAALQGAYHTNHCYPLVQITAALPYTLLPPAPPSPSRAYNCLCHSLRLSTMDRTANADPNVGPATREKLEASTSRVRAQLTGATEEESSVVLPHLASAGNVAVSLAPDEVRSTPGAAAAPRRRSA